MSSQNENNFFDPKTIGAVVLVGVLFLGWQKYLEYKYPDFYKKKDAVTTEQSTVQTQDKQVTAPAAANSVIIPKKSDELAIANAAEETKNEVSFGRQQMQLSSKGMGFLNFKINGFKDRNGEIIQLGKSSQFSLFQVFLSGNNEPINFAVQKISENQFQGTAKIGEMLIQQQLNFEGENNLSTSQLTVKNAPTNFQGVTVVLPENKVSTQGSSFLNPSLVHQEFVVKHEDKIEHITASSDNDESIKSFQIVRLVSVGSQYFTSAFLDQSETLPEVQLISPKSGDLIAKVTYKPAQILPEMKFSWKSYVGPKSIDDLKKADVQFVDVINLGFFAPIGKVLLVVLKWFNGFVFNWGFSIILLTLLVRAIVLPFNVASYKSMKKMQKIQPLLQSIRERYKDDPTAMNRETMAVMKDQKVNPIGGCLPMLLQMPVFFALYQVLGQSIELYQAPFIFWIHDLSVKDAFYVLPVLMGITMYFQQKLTPTTMDPQQAKILQWMPVLFSVFTLSLPAGLTLYIFVSTLFGVIQQQLFMSDRKSGLLVSAKN